MKIADIEIKNGICLAPLAGVSDRTFRAMARRLCIFFTQKRDAKQGNGEGERHGKHNGEQHHQSLCHRRFHAYVLSVVL